MPGELVANAKNLSEEDKAKILGLNVFEFFGARVDKAKFLK